MSTSKFCVWKERREEREKRRNRRERGREERRERQSESEIVTGRDSDPEGQTERK